ncbi:MAG: glutamate synthase-related protein [Methanocorpusculum sp.]|uniref:Glutamate synthase-related protein n=1 Tax=Methanocorpusculum vombati TaxID=3002864 RepID=A0ABT4IKX1_9EURY|nr:glutamate synthase-related protein [Methanocorpusculum vombati]MCZ9319241.1 glutamate synthase-related protein [Methanocorpusculum sp.]MCZ0862393.1 glutamate synthase-related protein [Methanocorpusculum vombati]MDE2521059.1 glutamate synthase-related protein [Methanocorpusculum sp.]MDE2534285.1 glutamate synthase-related protein [Methanocorpusculum sp.]MDE2546674.1 glutamate synthase-related protein [Methanocorpusculum sp.]
MGGHLPGTKVTEEIARIRGKPVGQDIASPSRFPCITMPADLKKLIDE